ncbi:DUF3108 domain-containing protein [Candidatus Poribacteria bacterium]|nr:DUF3108 domain-containing protein [Candidatus Poribacteria bacterium]
MVPSPLQVGEKLTYNISLKKLPAGKRTDWIVEEEVVNGVGVYRIQSEMKTRALFRFYKFRNQQETHLNPTTLSPIRFQNYVQDRKYQGVVKINFREGKAEYEKVSRPEPEAQEKREAKVLEIPPGTQDELSLIYFLRSKQFVVGETYFFPLLVKGKVLKATLTLERKEFVKNKKLGNVRTIVLRTSEGGRFWITDDQRRLPVKIETESKIGAVKATLTDVEVVN